jgi:peptidoglycan/xylan/chitin deacetylase (PgdA/CDA1 family)
VDSAGPAEDVGNIIARPSQRRLGCALLVMAAVLALVAVGPVAQAEPVPPPQPPPAEPLPEGPWPPSDVLAADPATVPPPTEQFAAAAVACPPAPYGVQRNAPGSGKTVALTFDDGPGTSTDAILRILTANHLPATFFDIGINESARPATVRSIAAGGFLLGNHSWSHPDMSRLTAAQQAAEMDAASNQQASIVGSRPCFFRPPYGASNSTTLDLARARNMAVFNWSVDTLDWEARGSADPYWVDRIINLAEQGGTQTHPVILFHNQPGGNPATVAALPSIIAFYRDRGYTFVDLAGNVSPVDPTRDDISPVGVAAVRSSAGTLLAFVRGTDGALYVSTATSAGFGAFRRIPASTRSGPAAVSWDGQRVDLFVAGTDRALWHTSTALDGQGQPTTFEPWQNLGGALTTAPAVASTAPGRLLVTARGTDGGLWSRAWDGTAWTAWGALGGLAIAAPAVDVLGEDTYRAMVVGTDGVVWQREVAADGGPMAGWASTGQHTTFAPAASATAGWARGVRAVAYSEGVGVRQIWGDGTVLDLGGVVTSAPALAEAGSTSTWTLARGADGALWVNVAASGGPPSWQRVGGALA